MRLYVDLNPVEEANVRRWWQHLRDNPQYIGVPGSWPVNPPPPGAVPTWQQRIVLEDQTRARYDQIAAQFESPISPPSTDPLARIKAAPSQWAKVTFATDAEMAECVRRGYWSENDRHVLTNWWHDNGVKGNNLGNGRYQYATYDTGVEVLHIDTGGADAATEQACGKRIPGPALP
jgi:hypothetical protein